MTNNNKKCLTHTFPRTEREWKERFPNIPIPGISTSVIADCKECMAEEEVTNYVLERLSNSQVAKIIRIYKKHMENNI